MKQARLQEKIKNIKEAIHYTDIALAHDDYSKPFQFKNENKVTPSTFSDETLRTMVDEVMNRSLGFDPELAIQHIEKEALNQFNHIALKHIEGKNIVHLMRMKHELELFMLNDRKVAHTKMLEDAEKELLELISGVALVSNKEELVTVKTGSEAKVELPESLTIVESDSATISAKKTIKKR